MNRHIGDSCIQMLAKKVKQLESLNADKIHGYNQGIGYEQMNKKFDTLMINLMNETKSVKKDQTEINLHHYGKIVEIETQVEKHIRTYTKGHKEILEMFGSLKSDFEVIQKKLKNFDGSGFENSIKRDFQPVKVIKDDSFDEWEEVL